MEWRVCPQFACDLARREAVVNALSVAKVGDNVELWGELEVGSVPAIQLQPTS